MKVEISPANKKTKTVDVLITKTEFSPREEIILVLTRDELGSLATQIEQYIQNNDDTVKFPLSPGSSYLISDQESVSPREDS